MHDDDKTCFTFEPACLCPNSSATDDDRQMRMTDKDTPHQHLKEVEACASNCNDPTKRILCLHYATNALIFSCLTNPRGVPLLSLDTTNVPEGVTSIGLFPFFQHKARAGSMRNSIFSPAFRKMSWTSWYCSTYLGVGLRDQTLSQTFKSSFRGCVHLCQQKYLLLREMILSALPNI